MAHVEIWERRLGARQESGCHEMLKLYHKVSSRVAIAALPSSRSDWYLHQGGHAVFASTLARAFRRRGSRLIGVAIINSLAATVVVQADEVPILEEVVVTSQKRSQSAQDVPISLSVLTGHALEQAGVRDVTDIARLIPTLEVQSNNGAGSTNYRLRRVGNLGNIPTFEPAVGLFVDGAFRVRSFYGAGELIDLDRVEVLNGPQSTLYGKNTTGGVMSIFTRPPEAVRTAKAEATIGAMQGATQALLGSVKAGISGPLSDGWGGSIAATWYGRDYLFTSSIPNGPGEDGAGRYTVRGQISRAFSDKFDARLILEQIGENGRIGGPSAITFVPGAPSTNLRNALVTMGLSPACPTANPRQFGNCLHDPVQVNLSARDATLLWNYHLENGLTLSSVTSWDSYVSNWRQKDVFQLSAPIEGFYDQQSGSSIQQELRLTSPGRQKLDWLAGAFYYHNSFLRGSAAEPTFYAEQYASLPFWRPVLQQLVGAPVLVGTPGQQSFVNSPQKTDYVGVFAQTIWNITDKFRINAGARWQSEKKDAIIHQFANDPTPTLITVAVNAPIAPTALARKADKVTWSITPQLNVTKDAMLYATAARGFKSGGYNTGFGRLPASQREFLDETVDHFEAGFKATLWQHRLQLNVAVFNTEYTNYQDAAFIGAQFVVNNAQKVTDRGAEFGLNAVLSDSLSANFDFSYADLKYATYTSGVCYPGRPSDGSIPGTCVLSGRNPINAPPEKIAVGFDYHVPIRAGRLFARVDADWTSRYNTSFSADPRLTQDPYTWVNARIGVDFGKTQVSLWSNNLLDKHVANTDALLSLFASDPSYQTFLQSPRSYGLTWRTQF